MATASLPSSCEEQQNNNLDEYSDDSDAESEKVRKAKKAKKPDNEKWSSSLICNLSTLSSFLVCGGPATLHVCHPALQPLKLWQ